MPHIVWKIFGYLYPKGRWLYKKGEDSSYLLSNFRLFPAFNDL